MLELMLFQCYCYAIATVMLNIESRACWPERLDERKLVLFLAREVDDLRRRLEESQLRSEEKDEKIEDLEKQLKCLVCCVAPREVAILPCGHVVACQECSDRLWEVEQDRNTWPKCPYCRGDRDDTLDVHIP